jgi:hypothetical protein
MIIVVGMGLEMPNVLSRYFWCDFFYELVEILNSCCFILLCIDVLIQNCVYVSMNWKSNSDIE